MDQNNFETQWTLYATNTSSPNSNRNSVRPMFVGGVLAATGAAVFSLPSQANASIVYNSINQTIKWGNANGAATSGHSVNNSYFLNLAAPGVKFQGYFIPNLPGSQFIPPQAQSGNLGGVKASIGNLITNGLASHGVKKLNFGDVITAGKNFQNVAGFGSQGAPLHVQSGSKLHGSFAINKNYFLGFQLTNGDLGYIELAVGNDGNSPTDVPDELTIYSFVYNDTPGGPIFAGQTAPVPEASNTATALMLLACAGGSLATWRRRKQSAA